MIAIRAPVRYAEWAQVVTDRPSETGLRALRSSLLTQTPCGTLEPGGATRRAAGRRNLACRKLPSHLMRNAGQMPSSGLRHFTALNAEVLRSGSLEVRPVAESRQHCRWLIRPQPLPVNARLAAHLQARGGRNRDAKNSSDPGTCRRRVAS